MGKFFCNIIIFGIIFDFIGDAKKFCFFSEDRLLWRVDLCYYGLYGLKDWVDINKVFL